MNSLSTLQQSTNLSFNPTDNQRLALMCGQCDENLRLIEKHLGVEILNRGNHFQIKGPPKAVHLANQVLNRIYQKTQSDNDVNPAKIYLWIQELNHQNKNNHPSTQKKWQLHTNKNSISALNKNQQHYINNISTHDINFGIGPAGTGKTFLAVATAIAALEKHEVSRIILVRPAVEAGEQLGFLPGDLAQKIDPYLRPMYDALYEMLGYEKCLKYLQRNIIEIAPLAYMRGRTLNDSFVILDEAQNTTIKQMKMFLTRIGFGSTAVITGDITQIDLPRGVPSGLSHAENILKDIKGISFTYFKSQDTVRHGLVEKIIDAYEKDEAEKKS